MLLITDEAFAAVACYTKEKKKCVKKTSKWGRKRKVQEVESESEPESSDVGSDSVLPLEILDCIEVENH